MRTVVPGSTFEPAGTFCEITRPILGSPVVSVWYWTSGTRPSDVSWLRACASVSHASTRSEMPFS